MRFVRLIFLFLTLLIFGTSYGTHNRSGEITFRHISGNTYEITIVVCLYELSPAIRDTLDVDVLGNGTLIKMPVVSTDFLGNDVQCNTYRATYTYPGPSTYTISTQDPNRTADIVNIINSVNVPFYLETKLVILDPNFFGYNSSPVFLEPSVTYANVGSLFKYNPTAFDIDGDSLVYELIEPKQDPLNSVPGYQMPNEILPGPNNNFNINLFTGEIIWDVPQQIGVYVFSILVSEYRQGFSVSRIRRDIQIIVLDQINNPPVIDSIFDTCVVAGALLNFPVRATDPDIGQLVTLTAKGGPFGLTTNPAIFIGGTGSGGFTDNFIWQTDCEHVRRQPYIVVFKAEDNFGFGGSQYHLTDEWTWQIKVVAPPPENVLATAKTGAIEVTWDNPYTCDGSSNFQGFSIWRKAGSNLFAIDTCTPGLAGRGYTKLTNTLISGYTYLDNNVDIGFDYCYRILAEFGKGTYPFTYNRVSSLPSNESCAQLKKDIPIIIKASVEKTDSINGKILVAWTKPNAIVLDTIQNPAPYELSVFRAANQNGTGFAQIANFTSTSYTGLNDTLITDSGLNTTYRAYSYQVEFYSNNILLGTTKIASSVFLKLTASDRKLALDWSENVPWLNESYTVFKWNEDSLRFDTLATTIDQYYIDSGLINLKDYCYFIRSSGTYGSTSGLDSIINNSQIACAFPIDTTPPCPPVLLVLNNCSIKAEEEWVNSDFQNNLIWTNPNNICADDVVSYKIYYAGDSISDLAEIANTPLPTDTTYTHANLLNSVAGCYAVTAIDSFNNESKFSNIICVDNCPIYNLPNTFTPNGDGDNEFFTPILPYRFIDHIEFKVFNRWGQAVFETQNRDINWDGKDKNTKNDLAEGVYFYTAEIFEIRLGGVRQADKNLSGYIHIIRNGK